MGIVSLEVAIMSNYKLWAKIDNDKISFFTEDYLRAKEPQLFATLEAWRHNYKKYQQQVKLSENKVNVLREKGIRVLSNPFLALKGKWHWFTGSWHNDAFKLEGEAKQEIERYGKYVVNFCALDDRQKVINASCGSTELTGEQQAIINTDFNGYDTLLINAYAGTGKTTTLSEFSKRRSSERFIYLAFNKSVADEAEKIFSSNARTFHSWALGFVRRVYKTIKTSNELTLKDITREVEILKAMAEKNKDKIYKNAYIIAAVIKEIFEGFCRSSANSVKEYVKENFYNDFNNANGHFYLEHCIELADIIEGLIQKMKNGEIECPHCAYLKIFELELKRNPNFRKEVEDNYDYILIDEAQDLNEVMISILSCLNVKRVFVGDECQQIYAWNGSVNAFQKITEDYIGKFRWKKMDLTKSFRCGQQPTKYANKCIKLIKKLKSRMKAKNRIKTELNGDNNEQPLMKPREGELAKKDILSKAFLGRTNKSIFKKALKCIEEKKKFYIERLKDKSEDGSGSFKNFLNRLKNIGYLKERKDKEIKDAFIKSFNNFKQLQKYAEDVHDIELLSQIAIVNGKSSNYIEEIVNKIQNACTTKEKSQIVLATAHTAKGLEFKECELADDFFECLNRQLKEGIISIEELNLFYVAITRAAEKVKGVMNIEEKILKKVQDNYEVKFTSSLTGIEKAVKILENCENTLQNKLWVKIEDRYITFFSETYLFKHHFRTWLDIKRKQAKFYYFQKDISLSENQKKILLKKGITVNDHPPKKALEGKWHWLTGGKKDAFVLNKAIKEKIQDKGRVKIEM